jgi:hypothetical protein
VVVVKPVLTDGFSVTTSNPKLGDTHCTLYGGVPPEKEIEIAPELVFEQSPVNDIKY